MSGRLERLWGGTFGDEYIQRNIGQGEDRPSFWEPFLGRHPVRSALEVGCSVGLNLRVLEERGVSVFGIDVNRNALAMLRRSGAGAGVAVASARAIPFADRSVDLVFTMGVLIHQDPAALPAVLREIVRCARTYVLCCEYFAPALVEVPYRGVAGALYKQDFGGLYGALHPELELVDRGELTRDVFGDDLAYWVFTRS